MNTGTFKIKQERGTDMALSTRGDLTIMTGSVMMCHDVTSLAVLSLKCDVSC